MHWLCCCNHCIIESLKIPTQYFQDLSSPFFCLWNRDDLFDTQISSFYYLYLLLWSLFVPPSIKKAVLCLCLANLRKLTGEIALKKCTKQTTVFLFWCNIKTRLKMNFSADREYARPGGPAFHEYNMCFIFHSYIK